MFTKFLFFEEDDNDNFESIVQIPMTDHKLANDQQRQEFAEEVIEAAKKAHTHAFISTLTPRP
ncbi:MAG: hypothetical protein ACOVQX_06825 [Legionella sp.]